MANKSPTGSLPPAVPLAITPTFRPRTHTSDDSYMYQLSLVVATANTPYELQYHFQSPGTRHTADPGSNAHIVFSRAVRGDFTAVKFPQ